MFSLVTLTGQNAVLGLSMRYARTRPGDMFISTTAVLMAELGTVEPSHFCIFFNFIFADFTIRRFLVKLFACLALVWNAEGRSPKKWWQALDNTIIKQPIDTLKVGIYIFKNCIIYDYIHITQIYHVLVIWWHFISFYCRYYVNFDQTISMIVFFLLIDW